MRPTQSSIQWVQVTNCIRVERPAHVVDKSPPRSEEIENVRCHAFTLPHSFMETMLNETQEEIYFYLNVMKQFQNTDYTKMVCERFCVSTVWLFKDALSSARGKRCR